MTNEARHVFGLPLGEWLASFISPTYLPMGVSLYLAMFAVAKFVLLLFNATGTSDRWVFELTPAFLGNLPDIQLAFLGAIAAGLGAFLQYGTDQRHRYLGMVLAGVIAASLVLGLFVAGADVAGANPMRFVTLVMVLGIVVLDQRSIFAEIEEKAAFERSLEELEEAAKEAVSEPEPSMSIEEEIAELEAFAGNLELEGKKEEAEVEEDALFAIEDLDTFERWLESAAEEKPEGNGRGAKKARKRWLGGR